MHLDVFGESIKSRINVAAVGPLARVAIRGFGNDEVDGVRALWQFDAFQDVVSDVLQFGMITVICGMMV